MIRMDITAKGRYTDTSRATRQRLINQARRRFNKAIQDMQDHGLTVAVTGEIVLPAKDGQ